MITGILAFFTAFFKSITATSKVAEKSLPDAEERKTRLEIEKPLLSRDAVDKMLDKDFKEIRARTMTNIVDYVEAYHPDMQPKQKSDYIKVLTQRVHEYRYEHKHIFREWILEQRAK